MVLHYYKVMTKVAHWHGAGKDQEVPIYIYGKNLKDAMQMVKRLPMVKHYTLPLDNVVEVSEKEFIMGNVRNAYEPYTVKTSSKVVSLDKLASRLWHLFDYSPEFTEAESLQVEDFCKRYIFAKKSAQKSIVKEYEKWAISLIDEQHDEDEM